MSGAERFGRLQKISVQHLPGNVVDRVVPGDVNVVRLAVVQHDLSPAVIKRLVLNRSIISRESEFVEQPVVREGIAVADPLVQYKRTVSGIVVIFQRAVKILSIGIACPRSKTIVQKETLFHIGERIVAFDPVQQLRDRAFAVVIFFAILHRVGRDKIQVGLVDVFERRKNRTGVTICHSGSQKTRRIPEEAVKIVNISLCIGNIVLSDIDAAFRRTGEQQIPRIVDNTLPVDARCHTIQRRHRRIRFRRRYGNGILTRCRRKSRQTRRRKQQNG